MGVKGGSVRRVDERAGEWRAKKGQRVRDGEQEREREREQDGAEQSRAAACCPHQAPLRIFHREFTSLDTTGKLQEWRSNLSLLASVGSLFFSQVPSSLEHPPLLGRERARSRT